MSTEQIGHALAETRESLEASGFRLELVIENNSLVINVKSGEGACDECLVPKPMFIQMVRDELEAANEKIDKIRLTYPMDKS